MATRSDRQLHQFPPRDMAPVNQNTRKSHLEHQNPPFVSPMKSPSRRRQVVHRPLPTVCGIDMIKEVIAEVEACTSHGVKSSRARLRENVRPAAARLDHHLDSFEQQQQSGKKTGLGWIEKQIEAADCQVVTALLTEVRLLASLCRESLLSAPPNSGASLLEDGKRLRVLYRRICQWWKHGEDVGDTGDQIASAARISEAQPASWKQARKRQRSEVDADADEPDSRTRHLDDAEDQDVAVTASFTNKEPNRSSATYEAKRPRYLASESRPSIYQQSDARASHQPMREPGQAQSLRELAIGAQKLQKAARAMSQSIQQPEMQKPTMVRELALGAQKLEKAARAISQSIQQPETQMPAMVRDSRPQRPSNLATAILRAMGKHPSLPPLNDGLAELLCRKQIRKFNTTAQLRSDGLAQAQDRLVGDVQEWWARKQGKKST